MNDTLADAVFLELRLREAHLNRSSLQPAPRGTTRPARVRVAAVLLTLAAWLAPVEQPMGEVTPISAG